MVQPNTLFNIVFNNLLQVDQTAFNHEDYVLNTLGENAYDQLQPILFLNSKNQEISSLLIQAIKINKIVLVKAIILGSEESHNANTARININESDDKDWTLLNHAMVNPSQEIISYLFEKDAIIHNARITFHQLLSIKNTNIINIFLNKAPDLFTLRWTDSYDTYLHYAIKECKNNTITDLVKLLATNKPNLLEITNNNREISVHTAVKVGNLTLLKFLLNLNPCLADKCNSYEHTLLHLAVKEKQDEIVEFLLEKYPRFTKCKNIVKETPFDLAIRKGTDKILSLFVNKNSELINYRDEDGNPAIFLAVQAKNLEAISFFLDQNKHQTGEPHSNYINSLTGRTVVHLAIEIKNLKILLLLLEKLPFHIIYAKDNEGFSPHDLIKENENTMVARLLRQW